MIGISSEEIFKRLTWDNPWWKSPDSIPFQDLSRRIYFRKFYAQVQTSVARRAVIMMGPRRVGKTVMLYHLVQEMIADGHASSKILYVSVDTPTYIGLSLEKILLLYIEHTHSSPDENLCVIFDEIQHLKDWEVHLKSLVDSYPSIKFIASGSAAAALRMKSQESGAGRFTDFILPPLTFSEFLAFRNQDSLVTRDPNDPRKDTCNNIGALNDEFVQYVNYGGYPEVAMSRDIQSNMEQYIRNDIIDKVLLRDLPSLYGINDTLDLNRLFTAIAYNTGQEFNLDSLSQTSGVKKATLKRYLEYLQAAFLIQKVQRIDLKGKNFQREHTFKLHLTNPSLRTALFGFISPDDPIFGHLVESAIMSQWFHSSVSGTFRYARWKKSKKDEEVDIIKLKNDLKTPAWAFEIKWSDRAYTNPSELGGLAQFAQEYGLAAAGVTTRTLRGSKTPDSVRFSYIPASLHCYIISRLIFKGESL